nr:reverse transcriptase domain-containing protein [Tanacetum cinerariifolium]
MNVMIVKSLSSYNGIIRRTGLKAIQAVASTVHGMLKLPVEGGIVTLCSTILIPTECALVITSSMIPSEERTRPANFKVALHPDFPDQEVAIGEHYPIRDALNCLAEADEEKTAFHTGQGVYCYMKMPFGLKNAGATYQRLMDKAFEGQIGRNIEVYVDDLVVKSYMKTEMMRDIKKTFRTLRKLKQHLSELPQLVAPKQQEELIMYLSATYGAVSAVLMTERGTTQTAIYFISRALQGPELNYSPMEKLVMSQVFAAKRLRRYFQAHPITVITDQPIKQVMTRLDVAGRLQK